MKIKYTTANAPSTTNTIYNFPEEERLKTIDCTICGKVVVPYSYIVYKFNNKEFCSWNCKSKYRKAHPEERELSPSEIIVENEERRNERKRESERKKYKGKYEENKSRINSGD